MENVNLVILFCDIHDFSKLQAGMDLDGMAALVQEIYEILGETIVSAGGTIVKYIGDSILATFPAGAEAAAVGCAIAMRKAFLDLVARRKLVGESELETAVAAGRVARGLFGHRSLRVQDVFGEVVNHAAVLKHYRGTALTEEVAKAVSGRFRTEPLPDFRTKWMPTPLKVWRIVD